MNLMFSVILWEVGQKTPYSVTQNPHVLSHSQGSVSHMLSRSVFWPSVGDGQESPDRNCSRSQPCLRARKTTALANSNSVSTSPDNTILTQFFQLLCLLDREGDHASSQGFGISALTWMHPHGNTGGSFYPLHWNLQNLHTAFVCPCTYSVFHPSFSQSKTRLRSSCQVRLPGCVTQDSQGERGAHLCFMYPKLHHAKWISNLTQSWSNGHIWESSQHSPCLFYIHNQHSNGCQGLLVFFGFFSLSVSCFLSHCGLQLSIQDVLWHYEIVTAAEEMLCYKHAMMQWTGKSIWLEKWRGARGKKLFQSSWTK